MSSRSTVTLTKRRWYSTIVIASIAATDLKPAATTRWFSAFVGGRWQAIHCSTAHGSDHACFANRGTSQASSTGEVHWSSHCMAVLQIYAASVSARST